MLIALAPLHATAQQTSIGTGYSCVILTPNDGQNFTWSNGLSISIAVSSKWSTTYPAAAIIVNVNQINSDGTSSTVANFADTTFSSSPESSQTSFNPPDPGANKSNTYKIVAQVKDSSGRITSSDTNTITVSGIKTQPGG